MATQKYVINSSQVFSNAQYLRDKVAPLAKQWIEQCKTNHESCAKEARATTIFCTDNTHYIVDIDGGPSRLLKIIPCGDSASILDGSLRIINASPFVNDHYVALSHRWGADHALQLESGSHAELAERGIDLHDLPQTFKDAAQLTWEMGYSYLWIDSLCIVQDNEEDWKIEARRMSLVFSKAICVFEATDGTGFNSGLITKDPSAHRGNLSTRSWVLQEQMLPPRSLRFTNGTVQWECRECDATEEQPQMVRRGNSCDEYGVPTHPKDIFTFFRDYRLSPVTTQGTESTRREFKYLVDGACEGETVNSVDHEKQEILMSYGDDLPGHRRHVMEYRAFNEAFGVESMRMTVHPEDGSEPFGTFMIQVTDLFRPKETYYTFIRVWWQFVSMYTKRQLSHISDKFLAINGITSVAQRWTHLRNSFGLWHDFIETDMCWYVDPVEAPATRPEVWLGPYWSWVSLCNGTVRNDIYTKWIKRASIQMKPEIRTPVGTSFDMPLPFAAWLSPKYYSVEVKGHLRKATVLTLSGNGGKPCRSISIDPVGRYSDNEMYDFRPDCEDEFSVGSLEEVYCLHLFHCDAQSIDVLEHTDIYIILRQLGEKRELGLYMEDMPEEELLKERSMARL